MPLGDFGLSQAFTVKTNASDAANDQIEDMKYAEQIRRQNEAMAMAKAKMFADDLEFQNGSNPYDSQIIKQENGDMLKKIGEISNRPEYMYDRNLQAQVKQLKNDYRQTKAVLRSAAWKEAQAKYNAFSQEALKNPTAYNLDQLDAVKRQMESYGKGADGNYLPTDQVDAFVFTPPEQIPDFEKLHTERGRLLKPTDYKKWNNGNQGAFMGAVPDSVINDEALQLYNGNKSAYDYKYKGKDPINEIKSALRTAAPVDAHFGQVPDDWKSKMDYEYKLKSAMKGDGAAPSDPYVDVVLNSVDMPVPDEDMAAAFGSTPTVKFNTPNGVVTESGNRFNYSRITDKNYKGTDKSGKVIPYNKDGVKVATGFILKPLEYGEELGVLEDTKWFGKELKVKPEYAGDYKIYTNKDGDKFLQINAMTEVNANSREHSAKYNSYIKRTSDQRNAVGDTQNMLAPSLNIGTVKSGYKYIGGDPASQNSWEKI